MLHLHMHVSVPLAACCELLADGGCFVFLEFGFRLRGIG
jgi:hypothetical protein